MAFRDFSATVRRRAIENINRKLRGQRITNFIAGKFSPELVRAQQQFRLENPNIRRQLDVAAGQKALAQERGFESLQEAQQLAGFARKRGVTQAGLARQERLQVLKRTITGTSLEVRNLRAILAGTAVGRISERQLDILQKRFRGSTGKEREQLTTILRESGFEITTPTREIPPTQLQIPTTPTRLTLKERVKERLKKQIPLGIIPITPPKLPEAVVGTAIISGEKVVEPSLKFLRGDFPFQKKLEKIALEAGREPVRKEFTIAVDVGGGRIQDFHVITIDGVITSQEPRGDSIPITQKFRESGRIGKSIEQLVAERFVPKIVTEKRPSPDVEFAKRFGIRKTIDDSFWGLTSNVEKLLKKIGVKPDTGFLTTTLDTRRFRDVPSEVLLWAFFAPAMSSGAAGVKTVQRIRKKNPLAKNRFDALGEQLKGLEVEVASKATFEEQAIILKRIRNQLTTEEQIAGFDTWVKSLRNKQILKEPKVTIKVKKGEVTFETAGVPQPELVGVVDIQVPQIREVKFLAPATTFQQDAGLSTNIFNQQLQRENQLFFGGTKQKTIQRLQEEQRQRELQKLGLTQTQIQKQIQRQRQEQVARQTTRLLSLQTNILGLKQVGRQVPRARARAREVLKEVRIRFPKGVSKTKLAVELAKISKKKKGVDVVVGMKIGKQRTIGRNLPPFKALKLGRDFVDKNIEASFRLKRTGKTTRRKDIKPFNVGMKFRPSKRNPLFLVEKRKFRLDSPTERRQIKLARRLKLV